MVASQADKIASHPDRLKRLYELALLDSEPDPALERLTSLASRILKVPVSLVSLVDAQRQFFASAVGLDEPWATSRETPLSHSFCKHVVATNQPLIVSDARKEPLLVGNLAITELNAIAYAGFPLMLSDGTNLGSFCVIDHAPHTWTADELSILSDLAQSAITELELRSELMQRKKAELALSESRHFVDEVLRAVPDFVFVFDIQQNNVVFTNRGIRELIGFPHDQLAALVDGPMSTQGVLKAIIHPDDLSKLSENQAAMMRLSEGEIIEAGFRLKHIDGTYHWFYVRATAFERAADTGVPTQVLGIVLDETDRKRAQDDAQETAKKLTTLRRAESEFGRSLELEDILNVMMDNALRFTGATDGYIAMLENDDILNLVFHAGAYEKDTRFYADEGIVGRAVRTLQPQLVLDVRKDPDYVQNLPKTVAQVVIPMRSRNKLLGVLNLETARPDQRFSADVVDTLRSVVSRASLALDNALLLNDKELQLQELSEIHSRLIKLEQLKTDMIRIAAHDLRNPLGSIIGFGQLLVEENERLAEDQLDFLDMILKSAGKMQKIIEDILSLERIEEMQKGTISNRINLGDVIRSSVTDMMIRARAKQQQITLDMGDMPIMISGDEPQIREAADNLISNAIKYTPDSGKINVSLRLINDRAVFEVEDNGIGIPDAQQSKLFSPFYRAKTQETADIEGTGLGLHLVKNIIERHHGKMRFSSVYGKGSMFGFEIPLAR